MLTVYFRLTTPGHGGSNWPVVVFQHGIGSSKDAAGHRKHPGLGRVCDPGHRRTVHGDRTIPGMNSGDGFFTANLLQDRGNIYQAAFDLWETVDLIEAGIDFTDTHTGADLDGTQVDFVAHSLGSIIGSVFLSQESRIFRMVLSSPSAILVNVLDDTSLTELQTLVASLGYTAGTTPYYTFLDLAQWLLDPIDSSYAGIGANTTSNLMTLMAYGDPVVSTDSSRVFLNNLGVNTVVAVDPLDPTAAIPIAGAYEYGAGAPVVHSFLLDPSITGYPPIYNFDLQVAAMSAAQAQVAGFLLAP